MAKLAFIGLGVMGYPMAGHLAAAGHDVRVYNRTAARAERWLSEHSGEQLATPREAATGADAVFVCVGNDDDVRAVTLAEHGAVAGLGARRSSGRSHHGLSRAGARTRSGLPREGSGFHGCAGLGGPGGRRERSPHGHVRRQHGILRRLRPADQGLQQGLQPAGSGR